MKDQRLLGSLVAGMIALGTIVWGSHELFFSRWEGEDLRTELRDGFKDLRQEMTELTKAILSGKRTSSAKPISRPSTRLSLEKPEAQPGTDSYFQSRNEILRKSGHDFWLKSFGEDIELFQQNAKKK